MKNELQQVLDLIERHKITSSMLNEHNTISSLEVLQEQVQQILNNMPEDTGVLL